MTEDEPSLHGPFAERLRRRYGDGVDPEVSLHSERDGSSGASKSGFSAEVLQRLATHGLKETRYRVEGEIARGGMGAILEVWDEDLRRKLAMKVVLGRGPEQERVAAEEIDPKSLGRFLEEAQVTGQLDHPGIVPVYELGLDDAGHVYFTMRLVKGRELREIFELVHAGSDEWTVTRALGLLLKVCEAMAFAHAKGVIHRDLKPANVMVGRFGEVYVMDWGLAHVMGEEDRHDVRIRTDFTPVSVSLVETERRAEASGADDDSLYTMDGEIVGTPAYMSPEQARGEVERLDARTDVYAAGAMLYHLLSGQMPFVPSGAQVSPRALLMRALEGPPVPLPKLAPDAPAELVAICERAMARDADARYADMQELARDLRAYLEHRVVQAYQTGAWAEARKWIERNRPLALALAAALLLLVAGLVTSLVFEARAEAQKRLAEENARIATERAADVLRLSALQDLQDLLAEVDELWPAEARNIAAFERWIERASAQVADLPLHLKKRAELRALALPRTEQERRAERRGHPDFTALERVEADLAIARHALAQRSGEEAVELPSVDAGDYPSDARVLDALAWERVAPDRELFGDEPLGLGLALRALELAGDDEEAAAARSTAAWGFFALGRDEEALESMFTALELAPPRSASKLEEQLVRLEDAVAEATSAEGLVAAEERILALEVRRVELDAVVDERRDWRFPASEPEARWWNNQLTKLIEGLEALEAGPLAKDAVSEPFGWSVPKRLAFARRLEADFGVGGDATRQWIEVARELRTAYPDLDLAPQRGLLPLGPDPASGLWEFADLATGAAPERDAAGRLRSSEASAVVFVLLPGETFTMGAQSADASLPNYDPSATFHETPTHVVTLSPFFVSKYELTQAQWLRMTGRNPSYYRPPGGPATSLLHPVELVSWNEALEVCGRFGMSLPSEAQWEYAARGGTTSSWWTGDDRASLFGAVNLADQAAKRSAATWPQITDWPELDDGFAAHAPVDEYRANPFGLHNVHGNVFEWCLDGYSARAYARSTALDPLADPSTSPTRVIRSGSFQTTAADSRSAARKAFSPEDAGRGLGVRPVRAIRTP